DRHPVGGDADDVSALERAEPVALGEPPVVADESGDPAERRPEHRESHIAGLEEEVLLVPEVHLAERPDVPGRADDDRGVVERLPVALVDAGHQMEAVLARDVLPRLTGRPVRDLFRESKGFVARVEDVTRVAELGQADQAQAMFTTASSRVFGSLMRPSAAPSSEPAPSSAPSQHREHRARRPPRARAVALYSAGPMVSSVRYFALLAALLGASPLVLGEYAQ